MPLNINSRGEVVHFRVGQKAAAPVKAAPAKAEPVKPTRPAPPPVQPVKLTPGTRVEEVAFRKNRATVKNRVVVTVLV